MLYGSSLHANITSKIDYEKCKDLLEIADIKYEDKDLFQTPSYIKETDQYGGPNSLPIVIINDMNIGGLSNLSDLVDLGYLRGIIKKSYLDHCLKWNTKRLNRDATKCTNWWERYLFFKIETKCALNTQNLNRDSSKNELTIPKGEIIYGDIEVKPYASTKHTHTKSFVFAPHELANDEIENDANKSQMVIGQNILDEFMVMDNTFEAVDKDQTPAFVEKRQLSLTEHLGHEYDESSHNYPDVSDNVGELPMTFKREESNLFSAKGNNK